MDLISLNVSNFDTNKRIDILLNNNLESLSRTRIQELIKSGNIKVNNKIVNKNYKVKEKDEITVCIPKAKDLDILAENITLDIIYEDEDIIIVNKPQGMVVHPSNGHYSNTLVNGLMYKYKNSLSGINGILRPGIVHRIDKGTSGLLVIAKNDFSHQSLAKQLSEHSVTRFYYAIVCKNLKTDQGTIKTLISRDTKDRKKMAVSLDNGKVAITHYTVLKRYKNYTLIKLQLETGRTHQIRVHMAYINHPILGDTVYGNKSQPFGLESQTLHAKTLGFIHPTSNKYIEFNSDLPPYFENILKKI